MEMVNWLSLAMIPIIIAGILIYGTIKKVPTYESFVEGGKEGIEIAFSIIPYLVGMLVAITVFRPRARWILSWGCASLSLQRSAFPQKSCRLL